jgi:hypothetical protein
MSETKEPKVSRPPSLLLRARITELEYLDLRKFALDQGTPVADVVAAAIRAHMKDGVA